MTILDNRVTTELQKFVGQVTISSPNDVVGME